MRFGLSLVYSTSFNLLIKRSPRFVCCHNEIFYFCFEKLITIQYDKLVGSFFNRHAGDRQCYQLLKQSIISWSISLPLLWVFSPFAHATLHYGLYLIFAFGSKLLPCSLTQISYLINNWETKTTGLKWPSLVWFIYSLCHPIYRHL